MEPPKPIECTPWTIFQVTFPGHVARYGKELIALPEDLLATFNQVFPGVLADDDIEFEMALRRASGLGFSNHQKIHMPALARRQKLVQKDNVWQDRLTTTSAKLAEMTDSERQQDGCNELEIAELRRKETDFARSADERQLGYVGWLITCPEFRNDLATFRKNWEFKIRMETQFPELERVLFGSQLSIVPLAEREFYDDYCTFFRKWSLHTLAAWDLPLPMESRIHMPTQYPTASADEAGLNVFLPWYLFVKGVRLQDLIDQFGPPKHLQPWIGKEKSLGRKRSSIKLEVYLYVERCLLTRYREKIGRKVESLDLVLTEYFIQRDGRSGDAEVRRESIRKVRTLLSRELAALSD